MINGISCGNLKGFLYQAYSELNLKSFSVFQKSQTKKRLTASKIYEVKIIIINIFIIFIFQWDMSTTELCLNKQFQVKATAILIPITMMYKIYKEMSFSC